MVDQPMHSARQHASCIKRVQLNIRRELSQQENQYCATTAYTKNIPNHLNLSLVKMQSTISNNNKKHLFKEKKMRISDMDRLDAFKIGS